MVATFTPTLSIAVSGGTHALSSSIKESGSGVDGRILSVPHSTTSQETDVAIDYDSIQLIYLSSDNHDLTVKTNATGTLATDTITVHAGIPTIYVPGGPYTNPFTADVTKFYVTNAGTATSDDSTFSFYVCQND